MYFVQAQREFAKNRKPNEPHRSHRFGLDDGWLLDSIFPPLIAAVNIKSSSIVKPLPMGRLYTPGEKGYERR